MLHPSETDAAAVVDDGVVVVAAVVAVVKIETFDHRTYLGNVRSAGIGYLCRGDRRFVAGSFSGSAGVASFAEDGQTVFAVGMLSL